MALIFIVKWLAWHFSFLMFLFYRRYAWFTTYSHWSEARKHSPSVSWICKGSKLQGIWSLAILEIMSFFAIRCMDSAVILNECLRWYRGSHRMRCSSGACLSQVP